MQALANSVLNLKNSQLSRLMTAAKNGLKTMTNTKIEENSKKRRPPRAGMGRPKGAQNHNTKAIKEMLLASLDSVGGQAYFERQAEENPTAFMSLISKIIPAEVKKEITGANGGPIKHSVKVQFGDDS
jgi:hypothetical protein